jgi:hypothetical protein
MDNDSLMDEYREVMAEIDPLVERRKLIEFHLQKNMENDGATEFVSSRGKAVIEKGSASIDHDKLDALYEYLLPHELAEAGAVVPQAVRQAQQEHRGHHRGCQGIRQGEAKNHTGGHRCGSRIGDRRRRLGSVSA